MLPAQLPAASLAHADTSLSPRSRLLGVSRGVDTRPQSFEPAADAACPGDGAADQWLCRARLTSAAALSCFRRARACSDGLGDPSTAGSVGLTPSQRLSSDRRPRLPRNRLAAASATSGRGTLLSALSGMMSGPCTLPDAFAPSCDVRGDGAAADGGGRSTGYASPALRLQPWLPGCGAALRRRAATDVSLATPRGLRHTGTRHRRLPCRSAGRIGLRGGRAGEFPGEDRAGTADASRRGDGLAALPPDAAAAAADAARGIPRRGCSCRRLSVAADAATVRLPAEPPPTGPLPSWSLLPSWPLLQHSAAGAQPAVCIGAAQSAACNKAGR